MPSLKLQTALTPCKIPLGLQRSVRKEKKKPETTNELLSRKAVILRAKSRGDDERVASNPG